MSTFYHRRVFSSALGRRVRLAALTGPFLVVAAFLGIARTPAAPSAQAAAGGQRPLHSQDASYAHAPAVVGDCSVAVNQTAAPDPVTRGGALRVTLTVHAACESAPSPWHLVLVVDGSAAAADPLGREIKDVLRDLVELFGPSEEADQRIGVVTFAEAGQSTCELSGDPALVLACIEALGGSGDSAPEAGLTEALEHLRRGRSAAADRDNLRETVLLVQAGPPSNECQPVLDASSAIKAQGVLVIGVCAGPNCDVSCTRRLSTSPRYFFELQDGTSLGQVVSRVQGDLLVPRPSYVTVTNTLPSGMTYYRGSAVPPADEVTGGLVWSRKLLPAAGLTLTLRLTPFELGQQSVSALSIAHVEFHGGPPQLVEFPIPVVNVLPEGRVFLPVLRRDRTLR